MGLLTEQKKTNTRACHRVPTVVPLPLPPDAQGVQDETRLQGSESHVCACIRAREE
jgi:hypothetical protein